MSESFVPITHIRKRDATIEDAVALLSRVLAKTRIKAWDIDIVIRGDPGEARRKILRAFKPDFVERSMLPYSPQAPPRRERQIIRYLGINFLAGE